MKLERCSVAMMKPARKNVEPHLQLQLMTNKFNNLKSSERSKLRLNKDHSYRTFIKLNTIEMLTLNKFIPVKLHLLAGENFKTNLPVIYIDSMGNQNGMLTITNYRLFFASHVPDSDSNSLDIPHGNILKISNIYLGGHKFLLFIKCKDIRRIWFFYQINPKLSQLSEMLQELAFPNSFKSDLFAYSHNEYFHENGWNVYNLLTEYTRLGLVRQKLIYF